MKVAVLFRDLLRAIDFKIKIQIPIAIGIKVKNWKQLLILTTDSRLLTPDFFFSY
jgi:hypothetical protein